MNSDLKLKYYLKIWKELPEYPTKEDVIYEFETVKFTQLQFERYLDKMNSETKVSYQGVFDVLIQDKYLEEAGKKFKILKSL